MTPSQLAELRRVTQIQRTIDAANTIPNTTSPEPKSKVALEMCPHIGAVIEWCTSCSGQLKHVRDCDIYEKCTLGYVSDKIQSCEYCEHHPSRKKTQMALKTKWAYGITTVPSRRGDLFPRTLYSLARAGFDQPVVFVDGEKDPNSWRNEFKLEVVARYPRIKTYGNWVLSLAELYIRSPNSDRYALFQDDFVTYLGLKDYLSSVELQPKSYWNLYTFPSNQTLCPKSPEGKEHIGWFKSNQFGRGAVALVFDNQGVIDLLTHQHMVERPKDVMKGVKSVDGAIVTTLSNKLGYTEYVHNPSLVQHTGLVSSMGNKPHKQANSFRGEHWDVRELLK